MDERTYKLVRIRDLSGAPRDVRLDAARKLVELGDYSAETLNILYEESKRLEAADKPRR